MTPSKPYLVRALYEWILDNDTTPYILVDTSGDQVMIPPGIANDGKVVLNLAPRAVQNLELSNEFVSFSARFNGVSQDIFCPISSLLAIYARENGEGMMFPPEEAGESDAGSAPQGEVSSGDAEEPGPKDRPGGPTLKVIK